MITEQTIRFAVDRIQRNRILASDDKPFRIWRGKDLRVEVGAFLEDAVDDISNLASLTFEVDVSQTSSLPPVMAQTFTLANLDQTLDIASWNDGSKQHLLAEFSATQANLDLAGHKSREFWMVVHGITNGEKEVTFGTGVLVCEESNAGTLLPPPPNDPVYYTKDQIDTLFLKLLGDNLRFNSGHLEMLNADTDTWVRIEVTGDHNQLERTEV